jgi:hypothetical protein
VSQVFYENLDIAAFGGRNKISLSIALYHLSALLRVINPRCFRGAQKPAECPVETYFSQIGEMSRWNNSNTVKITGKQTF